MDLKKARNSNTSKEEEKRFRDHIQGLKQASKLVLVVTDSQAMDVVHPWTLDPSSKQVEKNMMI